MAGGLAPATPAAAIAAAHTPRQRQALCTLATLAVTLTAEKIESPAILVIGNVVAGALAAGAAAHRSPGDHPCSPSPLEMSKSPLTVAA